MKNKMLEVIKTFSRNIHIFTFSEGILALALGVFYFLQILYYDQISIAPRNIGIIYSIGSLLSLIGFFIGPYIYKIGRKNLMCIGIIVISLGMNLHVFFSSFIMLLVGQALTSIGTSFIQVTDIQLLYSYTIGERECCAYSYKQSVNLIAGALGTLAGGTLGKVKGINNFSYKGMFIITSILVLVTALIRFILLPKDISQTENLKPSISFKMKNIITIFKDKKILLFSVLIFLNSMAIGGVGPYNNLVLKNFFHFNNSTISYISFTITVFGMVGVLLIPSIILKISAGALNLTCLLIAIGSCFILALPLASWFFVLFLFIRCIAVILVCSIIDSLMMSNVEVHSRDMFAAIKILVNGLATAGGNYIGGFILNEIGYKGNYFYGGVIFSIAAALFYSKIRKYFIQERVDKCSRCPIKNSSLNCNRKKGV